MPNNIEQIREIFKVFNPDRLISPEEMKEALEAITALLATFKKQVGDLNTETKGRFDEVLTEIQNKQEELTSQIQQLNEDSRTQSINEAQTKLDSYKKEFEDLLEEVKAIIPKDGENAKPEDVVPLVMQQIKLPEYEKFALEGKGEIIVEEINSLPTDTDEFKIDVEHIKGLDKLIRKNQPVIMGGGIVGRDIFKDVDLSSQLDGVTKTFNIAAVWNIISVSLSSYPYGALRKGVDFTFTTTTITFTDEIAADTQLASGQKCILTVVTA